ncbi:MAG: hypothetical protein ABSC56_06650 [Solirubrobacteraceae bacterium]
MQCTGLTDRARLRRAATLSVVALVLLPAASSASSQGGAIDPCLVGAWTELGERDQFGFDGMLVTLEGGAGRELTFLAHGRARASYASAQPLTGSLIGEPLQIVVTGGVIYKTRTLRDKLTFVAANYTGSSVDATLAGVPIALGPQRLPAPETFRCSATGLIERGSGFSARFVRG